jgi:hypothetical protein
VPTALVEYQNRLQELQAGSANANVRQSAALAVVAIMLASLVLLCIASYLKRTEPAWLPVLFLAPAAWSWRRFSRIRRETSNISRLQRFYRSGVDRLTGDWAGKGASGDEFIPTEHLYARDLNLFGAGSMFELLCTARTQVGRRRLASYLLDLPDRDETIARQEAVKELEPQCGLRELICLLGKFSFHGCEWGLFREWLESPAVTTPRAISWMMPAITCALALMVLIPWLAPVNAGLWTRVAPYLLSLALVQIGLAIWLRPKARALIDRARGIAGELTVLRNGLAMVATSSFRSCKLTTLAQRIAGSGTAVRKLDWLIQAMEQCDKELFYAFSRALLVDTQLVLAIERWKIAYGKHLETWLDAWAEFEALSALACYAHEHPEDVFPEMLDGAAEFEATGVGHPFLRESVCVRNDVHLHHARRFYLVSGSNMAGKSTFLRALGINAVLGSAGAPVRARQARQSAFAVCASVSIVDSLADGKSKFMAEVERLRETLHATSGPKPVLFAIDEILSGTNSRDRRVAAESFLRALIGAGALGALSTHDLALAEIADDASLAGCKVHMESRDPSDPFAFDYLLKSGVSTHSNALAIARMAGVPVGTPVRDQ